MMCATLERPEQQYFVLIGDVVASSKLDRDARATLQQALVSFVDESSAAYRDHLLVPFNMTLGDEFQTVARGLPFLTDLLWRMDEVFSPVRIRLGVGKGDLFTPVSNDTRRMDGPAFHRAREAIDDALRTRRQSPVFRGFGQSEDVMLTGLTSLLHQVRSRMTTKQRQIVSELRGGKTGQAAADTLGLTRQRISLAASSVGWDAYRDGEAALRAAIDMFAPEAPKEA